MSKKVFFTGATGYIGGAALAYLLTNPATKDHSYTAFIRSKEKAKLLESLGVRTVIGSLEDAATITEEVRKADVVIHTADSGDHVEGCKAIIAGLVNRDDKPIYIHISGTGVLTDDARGEYTTEEIYSDLDPDHINQLPDTAFHRNVELLVLKASEQGVRTHIVLPSTIYGLPDHVLAQKGISNPISIQMPLLIRASMARGQAGICGKGVNLWPNIHITEVASLINTVFEAALAGKTVTGWEGYYFGESGEYKQLDVCKIVAKTLHANGIGTPEPTPFTEEEFDKYYGGSHYLGANSRCRGERVRAMGWKATHSNQDFLNGLEADTQYIINLYKGKEWIKPTKL
ncbi:hypothetical protein M422DRAFT_240474 [Sphaerobolus stellatus SS14]|nr:hypothetical protein M422DRAFT_240474 [Sphaerobolus stellatus SS14]